MIQISLFNGETKKFNLKNFEREKKLYNAWYAMQGEPKFENKKIKIESLGLSFIIKDIKECIFVESIYKPTPEEIKKQEEENFIKEFIGNSNSEEEKRALKFLGLLWIKGAKIDLTSAILTRYIIHVSSDTIHDIDYWVQKYIKEMDNR